jgi:hypothetical protein
LGTVSGTKRSGYSLRITVSIRPRGDMQMIVRSNAQYNLKTVEDPEPYQQFFSALSKALLALRAPPRGVPISTRQSRCDRPTKRPCLLTG